MPYVRKMRLAYLEAAARELESIMQMSEKELMVHVFLQKSMRDSINRLNSDFWLVVPEDGISKPMSIRDLMNASPS